MNLGQVWDQEKGEICVNLILLSKYVPLKAFSCSLRRPSSKRTFETRTAQPPSKLKTLPKRRRFRTEKKMYFFKYT